MGTRPKVLITALRLYGIAIDLAVTTVPLLLDLAAAPANHSSYWLSIYSLLATRRL